MPDHFVVSRLLGNVDLSGRVIEAAIEVHRALGPGYIESVYENALGVELTERGIQFERQKTIRVLYKSTQVGEHRVDMLNERKLLVELKAVRVVEDVHFAIGRSYLRALGLVDGIILNFAAMPLGIRRIAPGRLVRP